MSVDITIQETVNEVDITVNQNVITVNVTRTTGSGGVESINGETGVVVLTTDNVNEGLINLYFTAARVRATVLTGISFVSGIAITATDTILSAFGKLQKQISSLGAVAFSNNYNDLDNKPTIPTPQNLAQTLAEDNKTNNIPIVSNNGNGYAYVNDEQTVIGNDFGGTKKITMNEDSFAIETNVRATIDGKGLNFGTTTDGLGLPQVSTTNMNAIAFPTEGMLIRNTTEGKIYQFNGTVWEPLGSDGTVTSVTGVGGETTVATGTTTPVIGISSTYTSARDSYADAKVADDLTASTTVAPSKTAVNTALDLKIDETAWVDYSASSIVVGCSSYTTKKINYLILGNGILVDFNLEGPSNTILPFSFTIPFNAAATSFVLSAYIINLGTVQNFPGRIFTVAGSNVVTVQLNAQNHAFSGSGTKRCSGQIFIQL